MPSQIEASPQLNKSVDQQKTQVTEQPTQIDPPILYPFEIWWQTQLIQQRLGEKYQDKYRRSRRSPLELPKISHKRAKVVLSNALFSPEPLLVKTRVFNFRQEDGEIENNKERLLGYLQRQLKKKIVVIRILDHHHSLGVDNPMVVLRHSEDLQKKVVIEQGRVIALIDNNGNRHELVDGIHLDIWPEPKAMQTSLKWLDFDQNGVSQEKTIQDCVLAGGIRLQIDRLHLSEKIGDTTYTPIDCSVTFNSHGAIPRNLALTAADKAKYPYLTTGLKLRIVTYKSGRHKIEIEGMNEGNEQNLKNILKNCNLYELFKLVITSIVKRENQALLEYILLATQSDPAQKVHSIEALYKIIDTANPGSQPEPKFIVLVHGFDGIDAREKNSNAVSVDEPDQARIKAQLFNELGWVVSSTMTVGGHYYAKQALHAISQARGGIKTAFADEFSGFEEKNELPIETPEYIRFRADLTTQIRWLFDNHGLMDEFKQLFPEINLKQKQQWLMQIKQSIVEHFNAGNNSAIGHDVLTKNFSQAVALGRLINQSLSANTASIEKNDSQSDKIIRTFHSGENLIIYIQMQGFPIAFVLDKNGFVFSPDINATITPSEMLKNNVQISEVIAATSGNRGQSLVAAAYRNLREGD